MAAPFDPYRKWLGIPPEEQPPNHYRLLGLVLFESDPDVIGNAADRQMTHVRRFQSGQYTAQCQRLLNELAAARVCLLDPRRKAEYDRRLQAGLETAPSTVQSRRSTSAGGGDFVEPPLPAEQRSRVAAEADPNDNEGIVPVSELPRVPLTYRVTRQRRKRDVWRSPAVTIFLLLLAVALAVCAWLVVTGRVQLPAVTVPAAESTVR